jgi:hypothetical protein
MRKKMQEMERDVKKERKMSAAEMGDEPEEESEANAEGDGGCDREVERGVFAAVDDVAGETAEAEREFVGEIEECAGCDEDGSEDQECAAQVAGGVHR